MQFGKQAGKVTTKQIIKEIPITVDPKNNQVLIVPDAVNKFFADIGLKPADLAKRIVNKPDGAYLNIENIPDLICYKTHGKKIYTVNYQGKPRFRVRKNRNTGKVVYDCHIRFIDISKWDEEKQAQLVQALHNQALHNKEQKVPSSPAKEQPKAAASNEPSSPAQTRPDEFKAKRGTASTQLTFLNAKRYVRSNIKTIADLNSDAMALAPLGKSLGAELQSNGLLVLTERSFTVAQAIEQGIIEPGEQVQSITLRLNAKLPVSVAPIVEVEAKDQKDQPKMDQKNQPKPIKKQFIELTESKASQGVNLEDAIHPMQAYALEYQRTFGIPVIYSFKEGWHMFYIPHDDHLKQGQAQEKFLVWLEKRTGKQRDEETFKNHLTPGPYYYAVADDIHNLSANALKGKQVRTVPLSEREAEEKLKSLVPLIMQPADHLKRVMGSKGQAFGKDQKLEGKQEIPKAFLDVLAHTGVLDTHASRDDFGLFRTVIMQQELQALHAAALEQATPEFRRDYAATTADRRRTLVHNSAAQQLMLDNFEEGPSMKPRICGTFMDPVTKKPHLLVKIPAHYQKKEHVEVNILLDCSGSQKTPEKYLEDNTLKSGRRYDSCADLAGKIALKYPHENHSISLSVFSDNVIDFANVDQRGQPFPKRGLVPLLADIGGTEKTKLEGIPERLKKIEPDDGTPLLETMVLTLRSLKPGVVSYNHVLGDGQGTDRYPLSMLDKEEYKAVNPDHEGELEELVKLDKRIDKQWRYAGDEEHYTAAFKRLQAKLKDEPYTIISGQSQFFYTGAEFRRVLEREQDKAIARGVNKKDFYFFFYGAGDAFSPLEPNKVHHPLQIRSHEDASSICSLGNQCERNFIALPNQGAVVRAEGMVVTALPTCAITSSFSVSNQHIANLGLNMNSATLNYVAIPLELLQGKHPTAMMQMEDKDCIHQVEMAIPPKLIAEAKTVSDEELGNYWKQAAIQRLDALGVEISRLSEHFKDLERLENGLQLVTRIRDDFLRQNLPEKQYAPTGIFFEGLLKRFEVAKGLLEKKQLEAKQLEAKKQQEEKSKAVENADMKDQGNAGPSSQPGAADNSIVPEENSINKEIAVLESDLRVYNGAKALATANLAASRYLPKKIREQAEKLLELRKQQEIIKTSRLLMQQGKFHFGERSTHEKLANLKKREEEAIANQEMMEEKARVMQKLVAETTPLITAMIVANVKGVDVELGQPEAKAAVPQQQTAGLVPIQVSFLRERTKRYRKKMSDDYGLNLDAILEMNVIAGDEAKQSSLSPRQLEILQCCSEGNLPGLIKLECTTTDLKETKDINGISAATWAYRCEDEAKSEALLAHFYKETPKSLDVNKSIAALKNCVEFFCEDKMESLLSDLSLALRRSAKPAAVDYYDLIVHAVKCSNVTAVKFFVEKAKEVRKPLYQILGYDVDGVAVKDEPVMHGVVTRDNCDIFDYLLGVLSEAKLDPAQLRDKNENTLLHSAAKQGAFVPARYLAMNCKNFQNLLNVKNKQGHGILDLAKQPNIGKETLRMIRVLNDAGMRDDIAAAADQKDVPPAAAHTEGARSPAREEVSGAARHLPNPDLGQGSTALPSRDLLMGARAVLAASAANPSAANGGQVAVVGMGATIDPAAQPPAVAQLRTNMGPTV